MCVQYLELAARHPTPPRMVKGHVHKLLRSWLAEFTEFRERINKVAGSGDVQALRDVVRVGCWAAGAGVPAGRRV